MNNAPNLPLTEHYIVCDSKDTYTMFDTLWTIDADKQFGAVLID